MAVGLEITVELTNLSWAHLDSFPRMKFIDMVLQMPVSSIKTLLYNGCKPIYNFLVATDAVSLSLEKAQVVDLSCYRFWHLVATKGTHFLAM